MELYINKEKIDEDRYEGEDLAKVLESINAELDSRVINEGICNGQNLNPHNLEDNPSVGEIDTLKITTVELDELLNETMADLQEYLPKVIRGFNTAAAQIKMGNQSQGYEILNYARQGLRWSLDVMSHGAKLSDNAKLMESFNETSQSLNTMLNFIRGQIEEGGQEELDKLQAMADELAHHYGAEEEE